MRTRDIAAAIYPRSHYEPPWNAAAPRWCWVPDELKAHLVELECLGLECILLDGGTLSGYWRCRPITFDCDSAYLACERMREWIVERYREELDETQ